MRHVDLAVLIPTLGRPSYAAAVVEDVLRDAPPRTEVVVVDQSDPPDASRLAERLAVLSDRRVRVVRSPRRGLPCARNVALAASTGEHVVFFDDDVRLAVGCLRAHVAALTLPGIAAVVGRTLERSARANAVGRVNQVALSGRVRTNLMGRVAGPVRALKGANMSFRRTVLAAVGGFDARYLGTSLLEDADVAARIRRAGHRVWFAPKAEVLHLSAGTGGVRQADRVATEAWRFYNTALYVRAHRGAVGGPPFWAMFGAIAAQRAVWWRDPRVARVLMGALQRGWRAGATPAQLGR